MEQANFPESVVIVGAGIFGLSTALAIARRHPTTRVTVIDRLTPPVEDGTSAEMTRCIRADYADPIYARLAAESQMLIEADPDLRRHYFKSGMTFACDGKPGRFLDIWKRGLENVKMRQDPTTIVEMNTPEEVFKSIHGPAAELVPESEFGRERQWNIGYCNLNDAFIDATESVRIYYQRCLAEPSIAFRCGTPVSRINKSNGVAVGVILEDGNVINAETTLIATGAWSNSLVDLEGLMYSSAIEVAWLKVTEDETERWKNMPITTNMSTGFNIFPPYNCEIKCLRRSPGYCNTVTIPHPEEDDSKMIEISLPRTMVTNPTDIIPAEAEDALRDNLRELMPSLANREFDRTKLCWLSQTPTADFIIAPHPRIRKLHVATGGSGHAWKFLPIIGNMVLDSMEGQLHSELMEKWAWGRQGKDGGNAPRVDGKAKELQYVVRSKS